MSEHERGEEEEDEYVDEVTWPVKGPATPRQALVAIAFLCFLCLLLGFVLGKTF